MNEIYGVPGEELSVNSPLSDGLKHDNDHRPPLDLDNLKRQMSGMLEFCRRVQEEKEKEKS